MNLLSARSSSATPPHSITSSARASSVGGTSRLSAFVPDRVWCRGPECRAVLLRKERTRQGRIVPTDATASIADHVQRSIGWRESVIEEFALTRQQLGPSVEERARRNDDVRPRAFHRHGACGRRRNSPFLLNLRDLKRGLR